jgi:hypothetical protein
MDRTLAINFAFQGRTLLSLKPLYINERVRDDKNGAPAEGYPMQCEQVRLWVNDYAAGTLPSYKAAWVAQHIAGCEECKRLAGQALPPKPTAPPAPALGEVAVTPGGWDTESEAMPLRRTIRCATILAVTAIVLSAASIIMGATIWLNGKAVAGQAPAQISGAAAPGSPATGDGSHPGVQMDGTTRRTTWLWQHAAGANGPAVP